jgi:type I restriction enzyme M protein
MLTQDTKKHIDAARQILVGVVPNPMSQVEQITNALIYKFMDDMDQQAIKAGGDPSFFVKDLEKYAWTKVMDSRLGNQERMNLYTEALMKFSEAKQLPQLFRDIFKQAFLPYRDPEVLGLFLKEISYFDYTHSEELGNAYEYLLSIMSSQGDAGQFRTPRHIIDFIVDVLAPTKDDTILDPACGTAGFLISAYNYIKRQNEGVDPETGKMRQLTADERRKLVNNFEGYDVDPTMVRLAQVNMYLHKFINPKIYNYNTLASEDRWNDKFDLILANPPFMSPKGGIKPHNRFSVQANRAEVLFVDYIMNHLKPKGRAGIIVPEGIIFQSGKAYKELRKNLVEDGLFAVVSLPSGVFNPYSGVKTSILFFDNEVAKKTKDLLFVKITNDGYDLGAQRRKIEKDDLGDAGVILKGFREYVRTDQDKETIESFISGSGKGFIVSKEKIAETDDYNLSADRYKVVADLSKSEFERVKLGDVCEVYQPKTITSKEIKESGLYKVFGANGVIGFYDQYNHEDSEIAITCRGATCGTVNFTEPRSWITGNAMVVKPKDDRLDKRYLFFFLRNTDLSSVITGAAQPQITGTALKPFEIPLPPIDVQKEIVEQIEVKQKAIEGAKQVIENLERERRYFGQSLRKLKNITMTELGKVFTLRKEQINPQNKTGIISYVGLENIESNSGNLVGEIDTEIKSIKSIKNVFKKGDVLYGKLRPNLNKVWLANIDGICSTDILVLTSKSEYSSELYELILRSDDFNKEVLNGLKGAQLPRVSFDYMSKIQIPTVPEEIQKSFIDQIKIENEVISSNKKLIEMMESKISEVLAQI